VALGKHSRTIRPRRGRGAGRIARVRAPQWTNLPPVAPESLRALSADVERARDEYRLSHWDDAERVLLRPLRGLRAMIALGPKCGDVDGAAMVYANAWTLLGRTREKLKHKRQARHAFLEAVAIFERELPHAANARGLDWADYGMALERLERLDDAATAFRRALELGIDNADVHRHLGLSLRESDPAQAEACFRRAHELLPDDPYAMRTLAEHIEGDRPGEALSLLREAAFGYAAHGEYKEALELFDRTLAAAAEDAEAWAARAEMLRLLDRCEEALPDYDRSLAAAPDVPWVMAGKAAALHRLGRNEDALELLDATLALAPGFPFADGTKGRVLRALHRLEESAETLRAVPANDPGSAWILAELGETLRLMGQDEEALDVLNAALDLMPRDASARASRAALHLAHGGRNGRARTDIELALQMDPESAFVHSVNGQVLYAIGDYEHAVRALERAVELDGRQPQYLSMLADALIQVGRSTEALAAFERALELEPRYAAAWVRKGALLNSLGQREDGLEAVERALELAAGKYPAALSTKGRILNDLGRRDEAESCFRLSLELDPEQPAALAELGQILYDQGRAAEGLELAERALAIVPDLVPGLVVRARALRAQDKLAEAIAEFERIVKLDPDDPWYHAELGDALLEDDQIERAIESLDAALALQPDHLFALATKGQALRARGNAREAVKLLERVVKEVDDEPWILTELAEALRSSGRDVEALPYFDRALAIDPQNPWALAGRGGALHTLQRYRKALEYCDRALEVERGATFAKSVKAAVLVDIGRYEEARELFAELRAAGVHDNVWLLLLSGWAHELSGDGDGALEAFTEARELAPGSLFCERGIAEAYLLQDDRERSRAAYREIARRAGEATTVDPHDMSTIGWAYLRLGQLDGEDRERHLVDAVRYMNGGLAIDEDVVPLQFDIALTLMSAGRLSQAVHAYERGIATAYRTPPLRRGAVLATALADLEDACRLVDGLADADATNAVTKRLRALIRQCEEDAESEDARAFEEAYEPNGERSAVGMSTLSAL
jgi:tetratricopeptide (TPR) repeat protein